MTRAAMIWTDGGHLKLAEVREGAAQVVGRSSDADVVISDPTVSRRHALLRLAPDPTRSMIEQLSSTNPTLVDGRVISSPTQLHDRAQIELGGVRLTFHDLEKSTVLVSEQVCSFCKRKNPSLGGDCWFCGTSLANAPTTGIERRRAICRVVAAGGETYDLYADDSFAVTARGPAVVQAQKPLPEERAGAVGVRQRAVVAIIRPTDQALTVNGSPASDGQRLRNGDEVRIGTSSFILVVR